MSTSKKIKLIENIAGEENVRVENGSIFIYSATHGAYVFFAKKVTLGSYTYDELEGEISSALK